MVHQPVFQTINFPAFCAKPGVDFFGIASDMLTSFSFILCYEPNLMHTSFARHLFLHLLNNFSGESYTLTYNIFFEWCFESQDLLEPRPQAFPTIVAPPCITPLLQVSKDLGAELSVDMPMPPLEPETQIQESPWDNVVRDKFAYSVFFSFE